MELWLIRHGMTCGNREKRYIGRTDEGLSPEGKERLRSFSYPRPELLFSSPMVRCLETAEILFPGMNACLIDELREMDFGIFENRSVRELSRDPVYRAWVDSWCEDPIPEGERKQEFQQRILRGFRAVVEKSLAAGASRVAVVSHGGTLMSVLDAYAVDNRGYYRWSLDNGCGYHAEMDIKRWKRGERCLRISGCDISP